MSTLTAKRILGYLFANRLHVFLMPVLPTAYWNMIFDLPLPPSYYLMIVSTTAAGYIFNLYTDHAEDAANHPAGYLAEHLVFGRDSRVTVPAMLFFYALSNLCALVSGWQFLLFNVAQHLLGCAYSARLPLPGGIRVKGIPFLKNIYAAVFWSFALILTPFVYAGEAPSSVSWVVVALCFGMSYFVELSWDLRDISGDRVAGVRTVPVVMGTDFALHLLVAVHILTCLLAFAAVAAAWLPWPVAILFGLNLPVGLTYLGWYARQDDKDPGSHLYVLWLGVLFASGIPLLALLPPSL